MEQSSKHTARNLIVLALILAIVILAAYFSARIFDNRESVSTGTSSNLFGTPGRQSSTTTSTSPRGFGNYFDYTPPAEPKTSTDTRNTSNIPTGSRVVYAEPQRETFSGSFIRYSPPSRSETSNDAPAVTNYPDYAPASQTTTADPEPYTYSVYYNPTTGNTTYVRERRRPRDTEDENDSIGSPNELDRRIWSYGPDGFLTELVGSEELGDFLYQFSPNPAFGGTPNMLNPIIQIGSMFGSGGSGGFGGGFGGGAAFGGMAFLNFGTNESMRITRITECTCNSSRLLDLTDVRGQALSLLVTPGTVVYGHAKNAYAITTKMNATLGDYTSGGACFVYHGEECSSEGQPQGTIRQMGTSI